MLLRKVVHKHYQQTKELNKINWPFLILTIILIINLPTKSFSQTAQKKTPTEETTLGNISDIINKSVDDKAPDSKTKSDKANPDSGNSISKIVSSLVGKKSNTPSLMFSTEEIEKIEEATTAHKNNQPFNTETKVAEKEELSTGGEVNSCVYLGSIMYHSPTSWATWINGEKITNSDNKLGNEIYVKSISPDNVELVWTMSISKWKILAEQKSESGAPIGADNQVELKFKLSFNQTYMLNGGKVIEGRISSSPTWGHSKTLVNSIKNDSSAQKQSSPAK